VPHTAIRIRGGLIPSADIPRRRVRVIGEIIDGWLSKQVDRVFGLIEVSEILPKDR
jgi:hypothetical protein